ncbi:MAG TPA: immunoglobulin domain-containing protein [Candidatus Dormibacteraeota bacterium]|nr:immunoglobulin domain-containing protein [Candidatus Dormibacteraeota bacterium]
MFTITFPQRWLAALFFYVCVAAAQSQTSNVNVRIMAANLNGNTQSYQPFALRIFQGLKPDVVAIQEFNYNGNTDSDFRSFVDSAFGTNFVYFRENFTGSGDIPNGVISRYPIVAAGSWPDTQQSQPNRGFAWAQIHLPGTNDLYVVSVHLLTSSASTRATEATALKGLIASNFPTNAWVVIAGDFNTDTRGEAAMATFTTFLSDNPIPTDAVSGGNPNTSQNRNHPHDYVLPSFILTKAETGSVFPSHTFPNGLVFDSTVYTPLSDVSPVQFGDSTNAQHMAVLKDFSVVVVATNVPPSITAQPQPQTVPPGSNATFTVTAAGSPTLLYQWRFNGTNLTSATGSNFTRTNAQIADGGPYSVVVTNDFGSVTSSVVTLTVSNMPPSITTQPQSQVISAGQDAIFTVVASGASLNYQWRFNGTNIGGATGTSYTRAGAQPSDGGPYTAVVTNTAGAVTSVVATLTVQTVASGIIAQWNFNSTTPDTNTATGTITPSVGTGTASLVGGTSSTFASGDTSVDSGSVTDNSSWNSSTYPAATAGNKTAGVKFAVSTAGKQNIVISWTQRASNTGSKYTRLQYTTDGTTFSDFLSCITATNAPNFELKTNSLSAIPAVNNNPNFAFRIVAEFEATATGSANSNYIAAATGSTYGSSGTIRYDLMTVAGVPLVQPAPSAPTLSVSGVQPGQFQFTVTGSAGSNYIVQTCADLSASNWVSAKTNTSPFTFTDTNVNGFGQRFFRAIAAP